VRLLAADLEGPSPVDGRAAPRVAAWINADQV